MTTDRPAPGSGWGLKTRAKQAVGFIVICAAGLTCYRVITSERALIDESALFLLGLPVGLAFFLLMLPTNPNRSVGESAAIGTALTFLIGLIALPEGLICWIMASPLFLLVGAVFASDKTRPNRRGSARAVVLLPLVILSFEGALFTDLVSPVGSATATRELKATGAEVSARLADTPQFGEVEGFLGLGFPKPIEAVGSGLEPGDERVITFTGGTVEEPAVMRLLVVNAEAGRVVFEVTHDSTALAGWLDLEKAVVTWHDDGATTTATWTLHWKRKLRPGFYFAPLQDFGMGKAADYLLDSVLG